MPATAVPESADNALSGGGPASAMANWMKSINTDEPPAEPIVEKPPKEEPNASPKDVPVGGDKPAPGAAKPGASAPAAPAKPEPAKPAEEPAAPKPPEPGEEKWPRSKEDWEKFKTKRQQREADLRKEIDTREARIKEFEAQHTALQEKLTKLEGQPAAPTEDLDRLKKINEELTNKIMALDVTQDPRFVKYFSDKTQAQINLAKRIVGTDKAEAIAKALALPDTDEFRPIKESQIEEIVADLNPIQQSRIGAVLNALAEVDAERSAEIAKANEHKGTMTAKQEQTRQQAVAAMEKMFTETVKSLQDAQKGMAIFRLREGDAEWNQGVQQRIDQAKKFLTGEGLKPEDIARASLFAASFPVVLQHYQADMAEKDSEIEKLQAQVKEMQAAQPAKGGTAEKPTQSGSPGTAIKDGMTPHEAGKAFMQQLWKPTDE